MTDTADNNLHRPGARPWTTSTRHTAFLLTVLVGVACGDTSQVGALDASMSADSDASAGLDAALVDATELDAASGAADATPSDAAPAATGPLVWARRGGGRSWDQADQVVAFSDGSSVLAGSFYETATFGAGEAQQITVTSSGFSDVFVARYNADGTLAWARAAQGADYSDDVVLAALSDESVVVAGRFRGLLTFAVGEATETTLVSVGKWDGFLARYNANGTLAWAHRLGGAGTDLVNGITPDVGDGFTLVGTYTDGSPVFGDGEPKETTLPYVWFMNDLFVAHYQANGQLDWATSAGGANSDTGQGGDDVAESVTALADGSYLVVGRFHESLTFSRGDAKEVTLTSQNAYDGFVAKYDSTGTIDWAKRIGSSGSARMNSVSVLPAGDFILTGSFSATVVVGPGEPGSIALNSAGSSDVLVARYTATGLPVWARRAGGSNLDVGEALTTFPDGSSVVVGHFSEWIAFELGSELQSKGFDDGFLARYAADGELVWAKRIGGSDSEELSSVAALDSGAVLVAGRFASSAITLGSQADAITLTNANETFEDFFIAKFGY